MKKLFAAAAIAAMFVDCAPVATKSVGWTAVEWSSDFL
jgi:hypothetical protein